MAPNKSNAEEYPVDIVDLSDDFKQTKSFDLTLDEEHKVHRFWVYLKCMKWQIELRANSFECFAAYFKAPSTWSAEVEFEIRAHISNSVRSDRFVGRFTGSTHVHFRNLKLHEYMSRENLSALKVEITMNVTQLRNFGMIHDYFDMMDERENTLLKVENKLIRVNKRYLAMMSPFFKALFYGELGSNQEVFEMPQEKFREVITFLRCIYPQRQPVTKKSVDYLLQMADRYQCQPIVDACEMFMCAHYHEYQKRTEKCFSYVEKFKMQRLLRILSEYISATQTTSEFRSQPYWRDLSEKTQLAVLEFMAKNASKRAKEFQRRRKVNQQHANIDPVDDQDPPNARMLGIADPQRNADGRAPNNYQPHPRYQINNIPYAVPHPQGIQIRAIHQNGVIYDHRH